MPERLQQPREVNVSSFEEELRGYIDALQANTKEAAPDVAEAVSNVVEFVDGFDYVLTTGASGFIAATLLQTAGIAADKFVFFPPEENTLAYKQFGTAKNFSPQDRALLIGSLLAAAGVPLDGSSSLVVADERVVKGSKTIRLLHYLSLLPFRDFAYATFSAPEFTKNADWYVNDLRKQKKQGEIRPYIDTHSLPDALLDRFFFPPELNTNQYTASDLYFARASTIASMTSPHYQYRRFLEPQTIEVGHATLTAGVQQVASHLLRN